MIKIYVLGTPAYHEDEEMVFKYTVYNEDELVNTMTVYHEYRKPVLTSLYSILVLLKKIPEYRREQVEVIVHDGAILEQLKGTSTTKNANIQKVAALTSKHLAKFSDTITIKSVSGNHQEKLEWERMLDV